MFSLWSYLIYFSLNSKIFISTTPLSANFWMYFFLLPCQKKRYKVHNLVVFSCYWQQLTFHFDSCIFRDVWAGMGPVGPVRSCCHKRDCFGQHSRFSFPWCVRKRKTAERRFSEQNALPKKPLFRQRTAPRQMLNLSQWRGLSHIFASCLGLNTADGEAFSFFNPIVRKCRRSIIELYLHNKTIYQAINGLLFRTG